MSERQRQMSLSHLLCLACQAQRVIIAFVIFSFWSICYLQFFLQSKYIIEYWAVMKLMT